MKRTTIATMLLCAPSLIACAPPLEPPRTPADRAIAKSARAEAPHGKRRIARREEWVSVAIASPPPARVRCSFDAADGAHEDVEWDPALPGPLAKVIRLRGLRGARAWSMACAADPLPIKTSAGDRLLLFDVLKAPPRALPAGNSTAPIAELKARFWDPQEPPAPPRRSGSGPVSFDDRGAEEPRSAPSPMRVHVTVTPIAAPAIGRAPPGEAPISASRSFDAAPAAAAEVFKILAEIALERARAQAGALLARELEAALCRRLVWSEPLRDALALPAMPRERRLLPRTCDAIRLLRVNEIMASADAIRRDLTADLTELAAAVLAAHLAAPRPPSPPAPRVARAPAPPALSKIDAPPAPPATSASPLAPLAPALDAITRAALDLALDRGRSGDRDAAAIVAELARATWPEGDCDAAAPSPACAFGCGVELLGALADEHRRAATCSPIDLRDEIDEILAGRGDLDLRACSVAARDIAASWPDMSRLAARTCDAMRPHEGAGARAAIRDAASLALDLIERGACSGAGGERSCAITKAARGVLLAAIDGEAHRALIGAAAIIERAIGEASSPSNDGAAWSEERAALLSLTRIAGAVTAYATSAARDGKGEGKGDAEALAAQREARRRAMESLLDGVGDRRGKGGKFVISLGASLGFMTGGEYVRETTAPRGLVPSVSLPLGIALQKLPRPDAPSSGWLARHAGFHLQLSAIDLGQFLAVEGKGLAKPRPDSFFTGAVEVGLLLGTPSYAVVIGADARYAPSLYGKGAVRFGAFVGFYVPFFDFD